MISNKTLVTLEFDKILEKISDFAVSNVSKDEVKQIKPSSNFDEVNILQDTTSEMYNIKYKYNLSPIATFDDILPIASKSEVGAILQMGELLKVSRLIRSARIAKSAIESCGDDIIYLKGSVSAMFINKELEKAITDSILSETEVKDDASDKLRTIRRKIYSANNKLKERLNSYTRSNSLSKYLQDNIVTIRNGRFVLPVKSECRSNIQGLIHDQSSTGSTVFIEPFPIVELNNELKSLQLEQAQEIERILTVLSDMVSNCAKNLILCQEICTMLDIVQAKLDYSLSIKGIRPLLNNKGYVNLVKARHPLIDRDKVVPIDLSFGKDYRLLLLTGPNTGGKTVCLKTAGLFCIMACCGILLPCEEDSEVSVFEDIFCDIGDEQSILNSLSTFSSHLVNIIEITNNISKNSLVLFDELGGGTDPIEGAALATGIIKYLELMKACGIITTHYSELKEYALLSDNLMNGCMQFDEDTLSPTYKLIIGLPGISNALKISKKLGINDYILREAYGVLKEEKVKFELVLSNAEKAKSEALIELENAKSLRRRLEDEQRELEKDKNKLKDKIERINNNAMLETKRIISNTVDKADELIDEMKELIKAADEKSLLEAKRLRRQINELQYVVAENDDNNKKPLDIADVELGKSVFINSLGTIGKIIGLPSKNNTVSVQSGNMTLSVKISDLCDHNEPKKTVKRANNQKTVKNVQSVETATQEVRVLGMTVAEAIETIEPIITSGAESGLILKIIHGKGTGALGRGIQVYLKRNPSVKSFRFGRYGEGETGVTIVEI